MVELVGAERDQWRHGQVTLDAPVGRVEVDVFEASALRVLVRGRCRGAGGRVEFYGERAIPASRVGVEVDAGVALGLGGLVEGHWWLSVYCDDEGGGAFVVIGVRDLSGTAREI